ncbi:MULTISPECIES: hypothetical protein [Cyanophyceae]|uniref:hypothetical protein n=1 Tax=Cyanophyceae TaxID=3028117 RepID=UPI00168A254A|nr:hypothetical protein [Trichocoleus sp. FACHB-40]MBD2004226.1 hypothetical protein [Trichocoleus sp. FACHB-40]
MFHTIAHLLWLNLTLVLEFQEYFRSDRVVEKVVIASPAAINTAHINPVNSRA